ncbi:MAG: RpiR family transcriptional regulator [Caloramator sp.]|jgi:DNA-binding MurR/RpiR family transcriptional regulator|uniref:MurR/RpiR family transcriptional regulator n=1 Tax=Caloramator sp. TaxID=1871330 RepID=UPI001D1C6F41|nr:MurR/RpiR family transcriptional regulator [Caloramator sp.]MBZ4664610.1 RpiR family transcriptional regulator [Caloramator sp.]
MLKIKDIEAIKYKLNKNENELLKYFLDNSDKIKNMTIQDVAKNAYTSTASIVRFCKKLGYSGFSEFKVAIMYYFEDKINVNNNYVRLNNFKNTIFNDIDQSKALINDEKINCVLDLIYNSSRIDFYGEGSSRMICMEMSRKFHIIGKPSNYYDDTSMMYISAASLKSNDIVFAISMSGETNQILKAVNIARMRKCKIVSLTNIGVNTLSKLSDINLYVCASNFTIDDISFISRIPALTLMEYIYFAYLNKYKTK